MTTIKKYICKGCHYPCGVVVFYSGSVIIPYKCLYDERPEISKWEEVDV